MTDPTDPTQVNFFLEHIGKILGAIAAILLTWMQYVSKSKKATLAHSVLTESPVSHTELLQCKADITDLILERFDRLEDKFMAEIKDIHTRINSLH